MTLHDDVLEQAKHLARRERGRPKQASLRRAVSAAYYSMFHLLVNASVTLLFRGDNLRHVAARAFEHSEMKKAALPFKARNLPAHFKNSFGPVPQELAIVANAFIALQEARHEADYNPAKTFTRTEALDLVQRAQEAFSCWESIKNQPVSQAFLASLLLSKKWERLS